ncbi:MAG: GTPase HflX [Solirubrobacteraceae bacterium]|nr:MAG: GTPase HflX [Solirubrobacterales bacterium]
MQRSRHGRSEQSRLAAGIDGGGRAAQRALCVAVTTSREDFAELSELLRTAGVAVAGELVQQREQPHPNSYLGRGKLEELKLAIDRQDANLVACDDELTPRQERNLEAALGVPVIDRPAIILDIFASHANSAEGKLQVELAQLEYNLARMRGLWTHLERLGGGIGTRGPGETQIETDRRLARDRIAALRRRLARVRSSRSIMRRERERAALPEIALAGYTNAGKSTLLNALTGAAVGVRDRLFHTLDPSTRTLMHDGRTFLLTDTVGFIRKLPHQLVDAFAATLEETRRADLLLHVADASADAETLAEMLSAVDAVLDEIGAGEQPRLLVLNKVDAIDDERREELGLRHPDAIFVSALNGEGLDLVRARIATALRDGLRSVELLVPYSEGARVSELHAIDSALQRRDTPDGVLVRARLPAPALERYACFLSAGPSNGAQRPEEPNPSAPRSSGDGNSASTTVGSSGQ